VKRHIILAITFCHKIVDKLVPFLQKSMLLRQLNVSSFEEHNMILYKNLPLLLWTQ